MENYPYLYFRWENKANFRYYEIYLQKDLFSEWCLTRIWGRKETDIGQLWHLPCESYAAGLAKIEVIKKQRERRGYELRS